MTTETEDKKRRYPTAKEWAKAEALWATGDATLEELAELVNVSAVSVSLHMKKAGITKGEKAVARRKVVTDKVAEDTMGELSEHSKRIKETKDEHYNMARAIANLTYRELSQAQQNKLPFGSILPNLKSLETAMNVITKAQQARWQILGLDRPDSIDDTELPELMIKELTAEQIDELRDRNFNDPLDFEDFDVTQNGEDDNEIVELTG